MVCGGCGAVVGMVCGALGLWWVGASGSRKLVSDAGVAPPPKSITSKTPYVAIDERGLVRSIHLFFVSCVH